MKLWDMLAHLGGQLWATRKVTAIWPWPAVLVGSPHSLFTWQDYRAFTSRLRPGDILITQSAPFFGSNAAIPGAFKHAAVYTGPVKGYFNPETSFIEQPSSLGVDRPHTGQAGRGIHERTITHAIAAGVVTQDVGDLFFHADFVLAVRPWVVEPEQRVIVNYALAQVGKAYDFDFDQADNHRLFCTELALRCCIAAGVRRPESIKKRLSLFAKPADIVLADAYTAFRPVCCSESCLDPAFQRQSHLGGRFVDVIHRAWAESQA